MSMSQFSPFRLTKLYSEAKANCDDVVANTDSNVVVASKDPEMLDLHRNFRIQKDRLITWGIDWSDSNKLEALADVKIDESLARAGLTDTVASVMQTINQTVEEAEQLCRTTWAHAPADGKRGSVWPVMSQEPEQVKDIFTPEVKRRYEELCKDLTSSMDILYDLSKSKRALQQGTYPQSASTHPLMGINALPEKSTSPPPLSKTLSSMKSYSSSPDPLVAPTRTSTERTIAVSDLPPRIDRSTLLLEQELPPAYGSVGTHSSRLVGHLNRSLPTSSYFSTSGRRQEMEPVLVEFAAFDSAYRDTGVKVPPTDKLDALMTYFAKCNNLPDPAISGTLNCLGYYEELSHSRYGLVYELPKFVRAGISDTSGLRQNLRPTTLSSLLDHSSKNSTSSFRAPMAYQPPPLETRFRMAFIILRSFNRLHEENIFHRDINSNTIMFFEREVKASAPQPESEHDKFELSTPYISGFDLFAEYDISSEAQEFEKRNLNLYQHPDVAQYKPYRTAHDLYSLGLVLLEIGMWVLISDLSNPKYSLKEFKSCIEDVWTRKLASMCGSLYMNVVKDCLAASANQFPSETASRHAISQTYNRMLTSLQRGLLLDENEPYSLHSPFDAMQNSNALEIMVKQALGVFAEKEQRASHWTSSAHKFDRVKIESVKAPSVGLVADPLSAKCDTTDPSTGASLSEYNPHRLSAAIDEEEDSSNSREGCRAGTTSRSSFGFGSPNPRDDNDATTHSTTRRYRAAAATITRAWRARTERLDFIEIKRKVTLIQKLWRERVDGRKKSTSSTSDAGNSSHYTAGAEIRAIPQNQQPAKRKLKIQPIKLPAAQLDDWHVQLLPRLEHIVNKTLKHSPETVSIDLLCIGETVLKAKATILITCASVTRVKAALHKKFVYDSEAYDLKVRRGKVSRSKVPRGHEHKRKAGVAHRSMASPGEGDVMALNQFHQKRPLCGASIGAYANGKHLPPVSYGGVVLLDGAPYGMTVHHLLDDQTDDDADDESEEDDDDQDSGVFEEEQTSPGATRSTANVHSDASWLAGMGTAPEINMDGLEDKYSIDLEISNESSVPSGNEADIELSCDEEASGDGKTFSSHVSTEGDQGGIDPNDAHDTIFVTQPAIMDVDSDFFPCDSDRDDEHLMSHKLGTVHASSGIRRWNRKGVLHEIDWALLKLDSDRMQPVNLVQGGRKYLHNPAHPDFPQLKDDTKKDHSHKPIASSSSSPCSSPTPFLESATANTKSVTLRPKLLNPISRSPSYVAADDEFPTAIAPCESLASLRVHCIGRTSGLSSGIIGPAMSSVRIYRRRSFARSWNIVGGFGTGGDSGAWVMENDNGRVVGHVLAWGQGTKGSVALTYFCPMEVLLEDMCRTLKVDKIALPGGGDVVTRDSIAKTEAWESKEMRVSAGAGDGEVELQLEVDELGMEMGGLELSEKQAGVVLGIKTVPTLPLLAKRNDHALAEKKSRKRMGSVSMKENVVARGLGADMVTSPRRMDDQVGGAERTPQDLFA